MTTPDHPPTLVDLAALDEAASIQIPDWEQSIFACSDGDKEYGEVGVLFPSAPDEAGMTAVTDFLIASKGSAPRLLAQLRALAGEWDFLTDEPAALRCASELRALLGEQQ